MISFRTNYPPVKPYFMRFSGILKSFIKVSKMVIFICYYVGVQKDRAKVKGAGSSETTPSQANSRSNLMGHRYPFGERLQDTAFLHYKSIGRNGSTMCARGVSPRKFQAIDATPTTVPTELLCGHNRLILSRWRA